MDLTKELSLIALLRLQHHDLSVGLFKMVQLHIMFHLRSRARTLRISLWEAGPRLHLGLQECE